MPRSWMIGWFAMAAVVLGATVMGGCANLQNSCLDPSGDRIFAAPPPASNADFSGVSYADDPIGPFNYDDVEVLLHPRETVAPVGSEVVLVAGVAGGDGYLRTNRRLEWSIGSGSVGYFVAVQQGAFVDLLLGDFNRPRKIDCTTAVGSTSRSYVRLNRGTPNPEDDVSVMRGEGWVSLTSPVEGTSHVAVVAPEVFGWDARMKSAVVHWVDAQWQLPPPAINPAGTRHVFTTTVLRQTNQTPCPGWLVRYEIVSGPPAGFAPDGSSAIEVPTNAAGQACAEIFQKQPAHGTNKVCIQVIRPGDIPGAAGRRLVVGTGTTLKTWTAADLSIQVAGPATAGVGGVLNYRVDVANPGDLPAKEVVVTTVPPRGLSYLGSNPPAQLVGQQLQWRWAELGARQRQTVAIQLRAESPGSVTNCVEAAAAGGLKVSNCAVTTIGAATVMPPAAATPPAGALEVRIAGPTQATVAVGSQVTFQIIVTNRSQSPMTGLRIRDQLDPGLEHRGANQQNAIERVLDDLPPGVSQPVTVTLRVTRPGRLCHTVEVAGQGVAPVRAQACVTAVGAGESPGTGSPYVQPPGASSPPQADRAAAPAISVQITGPKQSLVVGDTARFTMDVGNSGPTDVYNLKVVSRCDPILAPTLATDGYRLENGALVWQIDKLPAGKVTRLEVHCTCQAAAKACNRVTVTTADGARVEDQACLEIRRAETASPPIGPPSTVQPPPSKPSVPEKPTGDSLSLSVIGLRNPVAAGKDLSYEIRATNSGTASLRQISVKATVPVGMAPVALGTFGPESAKPSISGQVVEFTAVPELRAGESLTYRVRVHTKQAGQYRLKAEVSTPTLPVPVAQEAATEVF